MTKKLTVDSDFIPCSVAGGDELFRNGIFEFNISKLIEYTHRSLESITQEEVAVRNFFEEFSSINESYVDSVDVFQPVILAEISPGRHNLIDGNHRMEKARRMGLKSISAYKLTVEQHIKFLTSKKAYVAYIKYWNSKL